MAQSGQVAAMITERTGRPVEIVGVTTLGDVSRAQLTQIGGTGVFVSALRDALLGGEVDLAVHSLKDLPSGPAAGIALAAVPPRDDPRDALVARDGAKLADLPPGARIGTGSPRRAAQLLALRGDLRCVPIRGNAGTRLGKVTDGELDAVVLAYAGLARIGLLGAVTQVFEPDEMLPAPGQGALAVECRDGEPELAALLGAVTRPGQHGRGDRRAQPARGARGRLQRADRRVCRIPGLRGGRGGRPPWEQGPAADAGRRHQPRRKPGAARARPRGGRRRAGSSAATWPRSCCGPGLQISSACHRHRRAAGMMCSER